MRRIIHSPLSLVATCLWAKYFPNRNFMVASLGRKPLFIWRSLLEGRIYYPWISDKELEMVSPLSPFWISGSSLLLSFLHLLITNLEALKGWLLTTISTAGEKTESDIYCCTMRMKPFFKFCLTPPLGTRQIDLEFHSKWELYY